MQFPWKTIREKFRYKGCTHRRARKTRTSGIIEMCTALLETRTLSDGELIHSESKERNSTLLTNKEAHNFLISQQQANRRSRKHLFWMTCRIINLWNKQTELRRNLFQSKASKNSSWVKSIKKTRNTNKV